MTDASQALTDGFDRAAARYDLMVSLNPGYRRHLRLAAEQVVATVTDPVPTLLDVGCGSGLSTRELLGAARRRGLTPRIIGVDASQEMLGRARAKRWPPGVAFVQGLGEDLGAVGLPPADGALACYLLRNVPDLAATLEGLHACLRPGARLVAEEYSVRDSPAAAKRWRRVNQTVIEPLAATVGGERELYRYLHASVDRFMGAEELAAHVAAAGFRDVARRTVGGWQRDILHLVRGVA